MGFDAGLWGSRVLMSDDKGFKVHWMLLVSMRDIGLWVFVMGDFEMHRGSWVLMRGY